jgi:hypothetical protein
LQTHAAGVFGFSPPLDSVAAGLVRIDVASPDPLPEQVTIQEARFVPLPLTLQPGYRSYIAVPDSAALPLRLIEQILLPGVTRAQTQVVYLERPTEAVPLASFVSQGGSTTVFFEDYILVRAMADLPALLRSTENIAIRANELFPSGEFTAEILHPVAGTLSADFVVGGSSSPPDLNDALAVYAATFLPTELRTPEHLAAVINVLAAGTDLVGADIASVPGDLPPQGITVAPPVSRRADSFQISVQKASLTTPAFPVGEATFGQQSADTFPGFIPFAADPDSRLQGVEFTQLELAEVTESDCVIVHLPGQDPTSGANQIARSQACGQFPTIGSVRFAQFNASLNREREGQLIADLATPDHPQAQHIAEIIQRVNPDVLLINEFDFDEAGQAADLFRQNYLAISQNGAPPVHYPYAFIAPTNTGLSSGFDLDNDKGVITTPGSADYGQDAFGFGTFPGQFGMIVYSKFPIDTAKTRTFQTFLWKDMPGALLPKDPEDTDNNGDTDHWYTPEEREVVRLSSKSHWDLPININGTLIHALVSHPTPPVFDGPEDRNGRRNYDEIRFWADYITPEAADYIYDDAGVLGGLANGASFVIMGDQNADPWDGDSVPGAIRQLTEHAAISQHAAPSSKGGADATVRQGGPNATHQGDPQFDTADFGDDPPASGNLRVDYVLPSTDLRTVDAQVFWPTNSDPLFNLVGEFDPGLDPRLFPARTVSSDHRLVWVDLSLKP